MFFWMALLCFYMWVNILKTNQQAKDYNILTAHLKISSNHANAIQRSEVNVFCRYLAHHQSKVAIDKEENIEISQTEIKGLIIDFPLSLSLSRSSSSSTTLFIKTHVKQVRLEQVISRLTRNWFSWALSQCWKCVAMLLAGKEVNDS